MSFSLRGFCFGFEGSVMPSIIRSSGSSFPSMILNCTVNILPHFVRFGRGLQLDKKKDLQRGPLVTLVSGLYQPTEGAISATGVDSEAARSSGKLCALRSCITSIPRPARFNTSAQVLSTRP